MNGLKKIFIFSSFLLNSFQIDCSAQKKLKVESGFRLIQTTLIDIRNQTSQSRVLQLQLTATETDLRAAIAEKFNLKPACLNMKIQQPFDLKKIRFLFLNVN
jgi:hypothetical protein